MKRSIFKKKKKKDASSVPGQRTMILQAMHGSQNRNENLNQKTSPLVQPRVLCDLASAKHSPLPPTTLPFSHPALSLTTSSVLLNPSSF